VRLGDDPDAVPTPVAAFDGPAVGAVPLGDGRIAVNVVADGHCSAVVVDSISGAVEPFVSVSERSDDHVVDYVAAANLLVISTDATGVTRLGWVAPATHRSASLRRCRAPGRHPPGDSADGTTLAVSFDVGARSEIRVVDVETGAVAALDLPTLVVVGRATLTRTHLVVP